MKEFLLNVTCIGPYNICHFIFCNVLMFLVFYYIFHYIYIYYSLYLFYFYT